MVATPTLLKVTKAPRWTRGKSLAALRALAVAPALPPAPGPALPWEPAISVYKGQADLATGNLLLTHAVTGWSALGPAVSLSLVYNSERARTGALGPRWTHSYEARILGTNPAVLVRGDGREVAYALSGGAYAAPSGFQETLTRAGNGAWTLTFKDGSTQGFDASGRLVALTDANGNATTLTYSGALLSQVTDSAGRSLLLGYTGSKLTGATDPEGRSWSLSYSASGALVAVADPTIGGAFPTTSFAYNANGLVSTVTDRLGRSWAYAYGANGVFYSVTDPTGNAAGMVTTAPSNLDANGFSSSSSSAAPDQAAPTYPVATAYTQDAGGNAKEYGVDAQGRVTAERDGSGAQTNYAWDAANNRTGIIEPDGATTTMAYDARANGTSVTDPTNWTVARTFDARNNPLTATDAAGKTTTYAYDVHNNLLSTTDPTARTETRGYNANGTLAATTDGAGKTTSYGYGPYGDLAGVTDALGNSTSYAHTLGRIVQRTDALGRKTTYAYDAWKRLQGIDYPQSVDQSFTYDKENRLTASVDGTGTRTYTYDLLGRKTQQTDPRGTTNATYDAASRLTSQTDPTGRLIQYAYNGNGQTTGLSDPASSAAYTYDARRRLTQVSYSNGVVTAYAYDMAGRPTTTIHKASGGSTISTDSATYDVSGRLVQSLEGPISVTTTYGYDDANRLLSENRTGANPYASTYTYDNRGLRATALRNENGAASHSGTYAYDDAGRLTSVADTVATSGLGGAYVWNADGTLASMPANGFRRLLAYDEEGRLTGISKLQGGVTTALYQYGYGFDGGRRWRKDLANSVWDWYPCGVACCAGELVTLRSTNGGASWTTLERKLAKGEARLVDGMPLLTPAASGRRQVQGAAETAVTDGFGVIRSGAYGTRLSSMLQQFRGDAGLEQSLQQVHVPTQKKPGPSPWTRTHCVEIWKKKQDSCDAGLTTCLTAIGITVAVMLACAGSCSLPEPIVSKAICVACLLAAGATGTLGAIGCYIARYNCLATSDAWLERCRLRAVAN